MLQPSSPGSESGSDSYNTVTRLRAAGVPVDLGSLRTRYVLLTVARDYDPERLTVRASHTLYAHAKVARDLGLDDPEDIYDECPAGEMARNELREFLGDDWFFDEPETARGISAG